MKSLMLFISISLIVVGCTPRYAINHSYPTEPVKFPEDHAAHYNAQTEWWYYTGHLYDEDRNEYGFELTFFKRITSEDSSPVFKIPGHWIKDVGMVGHFAVTDLSADKFRFSQKINLHNPWKADAEVLDVAIGDWSARDDGGIHRLKAKMKGYEIDLELKPLKNPVPHGQEGIMAKGGGNANYYYSITRIEVTGTLKNDGASHKVHGIAWMDHEYGTLKVSRGQKGWDWFSIQLDDGTDLMLYMIRNIDEFLNESGGTVVYPSGEYKWLKLEDIVINRTSTWYSERTDSEYPGGWEIHIKPLDMKLTIKPLMADQELTLEPISYWEGVVSAMGSHAGVPVMGRGYVELVGYAKKSRVVDVKLD